MSPEDGTLKVVMPALGADDVAPSVNLIDAESLELVRTAFCLEEVSVPAGKYLLSSTLPTGERSLGVAEISPGEHEEVHLTFESSATVEPAEAAAELGSLGPPPLRQRMGAEPAPAVEAKPWFLRYLSRGPLGVKAARAQTEVEKTSEDGTVEFAVRVSGEEGVVFAQVAADGQVPQNVALPVNGRTSSQSCRLTVTSAAELTPSVSLPDNPLADAVARYIHSGALQEAASVPGQAEALLQQKMADPFGAALGGYALLRLHKLERLHDWSTNLASWFPWLPDGAIIAGEKAALEGNYEGAATYLCDAARRGLPAFADGFSMLVSRLREYGSPDALPPGVSKKLGREIAEHAERLLPLSPLVDFSRIMLAFPGARLDDPVGSQEPIASHDASEGWRRFSPSTGLLEP